MKLKKPKKHSKKEHLQDHAKNDKFYEERSLFMKDHEQKVPHGRRYGPKWFPESGKKR